MATQVLVDELQGCKTYLEWFYAKLSYFSDQNGNFRTDFVSKELLKVMFSMDFEWIPEIKDDEIRARDALEIRKMYASEAGLEAGKSEIEVDRIWKSIHGKCSVLELIFSVCKHLDDMLNEGEPGQMIGFFYRILIGNLILDEYSDADFIARKIYSKDVYPDVFREAVGDSQEKMEEDIRKIWTGRIRQFMGRDYFESGCCGGLFPLQKWNPETGKDQRKVSLWYQMNAWLEEHLDDDGQFILEGI